MYQLTLNQRFQLPVDRLFAAWKKPELLQKWFAPEGMHIEETNIDFKVGGIYRIAMKTPDGHVMVVGGEYLEIVEEQRLVFSWKWESSPNTTKVEVDFEAVDESASELTLIHSEFLTDQEKTHHGLGWSSMMQKAMQLT